MARAVAPRLYDSAALGVVYFGLATSTIIWSRFEGGVAFVWFAAAALLARLLTLRPQHWGPSLVTCGAGSALATSLFGLGATAAIPMLVPNLGEPVLAALLIRRFAKPGGSFATNSQLAIFLSAAVAASAVSGFAAASITAVLGAGQYWHNWLHWGAGHALGLITFTPLAHYVARGGIANSVARASTRRICEIAGLVSFVTLVSVASFAQHTLPTLFLPVLPIALATFRGGRLAAVLSVIMLTLTAGGLTLAGEGPLMLIYGDAGVRIEFLQFYLAVTVLTVLPAATELGRRRELFRALRETEARYRLLTESSTDIILNLDLDGTVRFASPSIKQIGGYEVHDVLGRNAAELVDPRDLDAVRRAHSRALADPSRTIIVEYRAAVEDGSSRWFETHARAVLDGTRTIGVVCAIRDVTHRKVVEEKLSQAASTDPLTGIANRRAFAVALKRAISAVAEVGGCVALFDLDHFKRVNDRFGHAAGDVVLQRFAEEARHCIREGDTVARLGGEEFAIILPGSSRGQAQLVCERLRKAVSAMVIVIGGDVLQVTVSGGVARYDGNSSEDALLAAADAALYNAKAAGRDRLAFAA